MDAETLKDIRLGMKMSQSTLAALIGIRQQKYSKIESNPSKCPADIAIKISDILGCNIKIFLNKNTQ